MTQSRVSSLHHGVIRSPLRRLVLYMIIFVLVAVLLASQGDGISASIGQLVNVDIYIFGLAVAMLLASYLVAAIAYMSLSHRALALGATLIVQFASGFINRLLPAGIGGLGLYVAYLRRQGHTLTAAVIVAGCNNLLGLVTNVAVLFVILTMFGDSLPAITVPAPNTVVISAAVLVVVAAAAVMLMSSKRIARFKIGLAGLLRLVRQTLRRPIAAGLAFTANLIIAVLNASILYVCIQAFGESPSWSVVFVVLSLGTLIGASIPTPGGLGVFEAALVGGFVAYGVSYDASLAAALLYRAVTYWLPMLPGFFAFRVAERRYL